jgi:two-component system, LytTR family, sensor kinase
MSWKGWTKGGLIVLGWTLIGLFFGSQFYLFSALGFGMPTTWSRAFASGLADWYLWGALAPLVFWFSRRFRLGRGTWPACLLLHLISSVALALVQLLLTTALAELVEWIADKPFPFLAGLCFALVVKFHWNIVIYWAILGLSHALTYYRESRERELHAAKLQAQLVQAQLQSLKTQLHPHFLFNSLNGISELIYEDPERADRMIIHLSELLRMSLEAGSTDEVPLRQELDFLERYLEIQKTRFGDRLTMRLDIDPGVGDALVPNLILQPLVENAIRHGIGQRSAPGRIEIHARLQDQMLCLQVCDNGSGLPEGGASAVKEGVGLGNTRERLRQLYGAAQSLALSSPPGGGLRVTLVFPLRTKPAGNAPPPSENIRENARASCGRRTAGA